MNRTIIAVAIVALVAVGAYAYYFSSSGTDDLHVDKVRDTIQVGDVIEFTYITMDKGIITYDKKVTWKITKVGEKEVMLEEYEDGVFDIEKAEYIYAVWELIDRDANDPSRPIQDVKKEKKTIDTAFGKRTVTEEIITGYDDLGKWEMTYVYGEDGAMYEAKFGDEEGYNRVVILKCTLYE